ncbi:NAD-glutamate dehydrogenase [Paeniglutamicibacter psychrophenolicus]|uniref:Glutamate dehydrogenase n=1 Tax=Paeniglutamicibacter psychrophenolicus TaxID=257454 RepID=A0ABS4WIE9_9MICC|nr:NAD-glutamate dehydrogenase [Paeniglutamicibacter psychrophenolicus]MBP2375970.1 glutamate dehydrogenase [Paeniglutamicibacter psychrophenolicus]
MNAGKFVEDYYRHFAAADLDGYAPDTLEQRALFHLGVAGARPPGQVATGILAETDASVVAIAVENMPYLVNSVTAELTRQGAAIRLVVHPIFAVLRDKHSHRILDIHLLPAPGAPTHLEATERSYACEESWLAVEIRSPGDASAGQLLLESIATVVTDVAAVATDAGAMHQQALGVIDSLGTRPGSGNRQEREQAQDLLRWMLDGNFTFLGYGDYDVPDGGGLQSLASRPSSGLGLLRETPGGPRQPRPALPGLRRPLGQRLLTLTKADWRSTVLRPSYLDQVAVKDHGADGKANRERHFLGLFAPGAYNQPVGEVPIVRDKVAEVLTRCAFAPDSHSGETLQAVLESYPRDELFQIEVDDLLTTALGIVHLQERRRTRLFLRPDAYGRFVSALVFLPRDRYNTAVRQRIEHELGQGFGTTTIEFAAQLSESALARVFFRIWLPSGSTLPRIDAQALERRLAVAVRSWAEGVEEVLHERFPAAEAARLGMLWAEAFPAGYRVGHRVEDAVDDIVHFEELGLRDAGGPEVDDPVVSVRLPAAASSTLAEDARIKLYFAKPRSLSRILPFFHNLGLEVLDQRPFEIRRGDNQEFLLYDIGLKYPSGVDPMETSGLLSNAFRAAMRGETESDGFDGLVLAEGIEWQRVVILRSYAKYLLQLGTTNSYGFMAESLLANVRVTRALLGLFETSFDPGREGTDRAGDIVIARKELVAAIDEVPALNADRLLRTFTNLVGATVRTNYFQHRPYLSFKFDSSAIPECPLPRPKHEIWVYSPRVEGLHLRFGAIARGGLRWSDRREDFRTEILGLVKAQTVKNAVIVPTGAKGGFFPKQLPDPLLDRDAWLEEGRESYRDFIRGMLDITDNLGTTDTGKVPVPPRNVVCHDGADSYLVVAADKGTATFSDTANELAREYGYWLGDAFASGGSVGYDHKEMGITARGAWESVKAHFGELGIDVQNEDFTVAGIGDMSGDVFGNAMLRSRHIRLVAAFDHRHIFLDPHPDAAASYAERKRLFGLPRSSWADFDASVVSDGGGVHPRHAKSIHITDQVRGALGLEDGITELAPAELLQAILRAPVDLLYNGGIGTYVKASSEPHEVAGDKANDSIRVNGNELRARVVVEGGNLGITQHGRIEAALGGILVNTDAIDNSAGVDCSDHEVNIKILVDNLIAAGKLGAGERADFLHSLTNEVGTLVLKTNADQNTLLVNDLYRVGPWSPGFERMMDWLESAAGLDRRLEGLPGTGELHARLAEGHGLTGPELAVLCAYAKTELASALIASDLPDDPWFKQTLRSYFPARLSERFDADLDTHPLRREIIGTVVANDMINMGGITYAFRAAEETEASPAAVARAFVVLRRVFDLDSVMSELAALPPSCPAENRCVVAEQMRRLLDRGTRWYVTRDGRGESVADTIERFKPRIDPLWADLTRYLRESDLTFLYARLADHMAGIPAGMARRSPTILAGFGLLDLAVISEQIREPVHNIAQVYFALYARIGVIRLLLMITDLPRHNRWESQARAALRDDLYSAVADMTVAVMQGTGSTGRGADPLERIAAWEGQHAQRMSRISETLEQLAGPGQADFASVSVFLKQLRSVVRS